MKDDIDNLLSKGGLSGAQRERVLNAVLDHVAPARPPVPRVAVIAVAATALAGAVAAYVLSGRPKHDAFASRGGDHAAAQVEVVCLSGSLDACPRGSHLAFRPWGLSQARSGYLSAYAEPEGGGERVWYFSADQESPRVGSSPASTEPMDRVIVLGQEHADGAYAVHILISDRPLPRAQVIRPAAEAVILSETIRLRVVP